MKIGVIGTGYVGLVTGVCLGELGHEVVCIDRDAVIIDRLSRGEMVIYEPGLDAYLNRLGKAEKLSFTTDIRRVALCDIVVIAVGTPQLPGGECDLTDLEAAVRAAASHFSGYTLLMTKSTVPVGTNERIKGWATEMAAAPLDVVSVPEFMREGSALDDAFHPDRIVIGTDCEQAGLMAAKLLRPLTDRMIITDFRTAELTKYASNAFLATKISFINEMANLCDKVGADVAVIAEGMGMDPRIGPAFLKAGIGYGGSCFPKDTNALLQIAGDVDYEFRLLKAVIEVNRMQREWVVDTLSEQLGTFEGKAICIWGASFKPGTDDVRSAPSLDIVPELLKLGADVKMCDPAAGPNFRKVCADERISWHSDPLEAASGTHAVCLLTEWTQFTAVDLRRLAPDMLSPLLIDGRNALDPAQAEAAGLAYIGIGRPAYRTAIRCRNFDKV
jgi:UDPglucose 6-dehydrogenase